ncbi:MAG: lasso peptide biosynthesis protein [Deltaproteobacteria bacterium]|nr:lasso peptide biosynthesis protein [Deltaproteobacteria bacterium]
MKKVRTKGPWHAVGVVIVVTWLVMLGLLIRKIHFSAPEAVSSAQGGGSLSIQGVQREWKELFFKEKKIGYAVYFLRPAADGYIIQEEMFLKLNLMGLASGVYTVTHCETDERFRLRRFRFRMTSGTIGFEAQGRIEGGVLVVRTGREGGQSVQRIPLDEKPVMGVSLEYLFKQRPLEVGQAYRFPLFDPSSMSRRNIEVRVTSRETIRIRGIVYDAFRLEAEVWGDRLTFWLDENGTALKETGFMGLTAVRSSAAVAPENIQGSGDLDFYEISAVVPDRNISRPRSVSFLEVRLKGLDRVAVDQSAWDGGRQRFSPPVLEISREKPPLEAGYEVPWAGGRERFQEALAPEFNIESGHEEIVRAAEEIAGAEKDPVAVTRRVQAWVYTKVKKRPVVSIPSALEVLRTRVGDCNEHATLTTALLRALGIPARIAVGLVYTRGKFFYHAWTEAWVGEWVSLDATLNQMPVDATHIKLLEGNLDRQVDVAGLIGRLKLQVMDYRHD